MDNQNDPNSHPAYTPTPPAAPPPPPQPQPEYPTLPPNPDPMQSQAAWAPAAQTRNPWTSLPQSAPITLPPNPDPIPNQPVTIPEPPGNPPSDLNAPWTPPAELTPNPPAAWTAPSEAIPPVFHPEPAPSAPQSTASPLDNPWGAPSQPPPLDGSQTPTQPSWMNTPLMTNTDQSVPVAPVESAPTDLSHLISGNNNIPAEGAAASVETLVAPSPAVNPVLPNVQTETHKGIPKWIFGLGAGLLILVIAASAYFILGIGQPAKSTTSLPATTQTARTEPPVPAAIPTSQPAAAPQATTPAESANFGELQGGNTQQATSAADLLRQRQQQGR